MMLMVFSDHSEAEDSARCTVRNLEGCDVVPAVQRVINAVKKEALDQCEVNYTSPEPDAGDPADELEEAECRPSIICGIEAAFNCVDNFVESENQSNPCA